MLHEWRQIGRSRDGVILLGSTLNATVGPRGAYVVAGVTGLVAVAVAAARLRPHLRARAPPWED